MPSRPRANRRFWPRPRLFIPLVLFLGSKHFFDLCLGYPIFWYLIVAPEPRAGVWETLPEVFRDFCFSVALVGFVLYSQFWWVRASAPAGCSPRGPRGVSLLL